jgi:hypothetical protein
MFEHVLLDSPQPFVPVGLSNRQYRPWAITFLAAAVASLCFGAFIPTSAVTHAVEGAAIITQLVALSRLWAAFKR